MDDLRAVAASLVFVCHASLAWLASEGHPVDHGGLLYLGLFGVTLLAAHLSFVLVERPLMRGAARFATQRRPAAQPSHLGHAAVTPDSALGMTSTG